MDSTKGVKSTCKHEEGHPMRRWVLGQENQCLSERRRKAGMNQAETFGYKTATHSRTAADGLAPLVADFYMAFVVQVHGKQEQSKRRKLRPSLGNSKHYVPLLKMTTSVYEEQRGDAYSEQSAQFRGG